jgi:hypothetical protein
MLWVGWQPWVHDLLNATVGLEVFGYGHGVGGVPLHTHMQSLHTTQRQIRVHGTGDGADAILQEAKLVVDLIAVGSHNTHDHIAVPVDVFGDTVHHNVRAEAERGLQIQALIVSAQTPSNKPE